MTSLASRLRPMVLAATLVGLAGCGSTIAGTASPYLDPSRAAPGSTAESAPGSTAAPVAPGGIDGETGATGIGDPYYPESGNGGYDVSGYDVVLSYDPDQGSIEATTTIDLTVTSASRLGRFSFDLQESLTVSAVTVNGQATAFEQDPAKLILTPGTGLEPGTEATVAVSYAGKPGVKEGGTAGLGDGGWYSLDDGGAVVAGEPLSASTWYPANEHPLDRATFRVTTTVPTGWEVISNGLPVTEGLPDPPAGQAVFGWREDAPMATYLSTLYIDKFTTTEDTTGSGIKIINAFAPGGGERFVDLADNTAEVVDFLETVFGPYPFTSAGGIYTNESLSFALETQTRPVYADWVTLDTVVHELAHQWYGDAVAVDAWADICLNECFASYAPWLWYEEKDDLDLDQSYRDEIATYRDMPDYWERPLVDPGAGYEFTDVYARGPLALHALRNYIGDDKFYALLRNWPKDFVGQNKSFDDWADMVSDIAGEDMTGFIDAWFRKGGVPEDAYLFPGDLQ